ncbi:MAG: type IV secretory system conjugative DNA transfer family protein, partial [Rhodospirillales bacterium]|nr:type IV secretory system conjugative DNA transfer family protein [Rhodospirillales bacterium]
MTMIDAHSGNWFVTDVDGTISATFADRMGSGSRGIIGKNRDFHILSPGGPVGGVASSSWNPFDELHRIEKRCGRDRVYHLATVMTKNLITPRKDHEVGNQSFFNEHNEALVLACILYIHDTRPAERRNLSELRQLITCGESGGPADMSPFTFLLLNMSRNNAFNGAISKRAVILCNTPVDTRESVFATAAGQTAWMDDPNVMMISNNSDFSLDDLKSGKLCLSAVASTGDLRTVLTPWYRMLVGMMCFILESSPPHKPVMMALDELANVGRIDGLASAPQTLRKYNVHVICVTQSIDLLKSTYGEAGLQFLNDAYYVIWMGTNSNSDAEYLMTQLGSHTKAKTRVKREEVHGAVDRSVLDIDQVRRFMDGDNIIVTRPGKRPMRLKALPYYRELAVYQYRSTKLFREKFGRRIGRIICKLLLRGKPISDADLDAARYVLGLPRSFIKQDVD